MTIKEFSHKNGLVFFWTTVVLAILLLITITINCLARFDDDYDRYPNMMRRDIDTRNIQRPMLNGRVFQNRPDIITDQNQSTTSANTSPKNQ